MAFSRLFRCAVRKAGSVNGDLALAIGQIFVVGAAGASSALGALSVWRRFIPLIIIKMTNAIIMKLITEVINAP